MKKICLLLALTVAFGSLVGCKEDGKEVGKENNVQTSTPVNTKEYAFDEISYMQSSTPQQTDDTYLNVNVPMKESVPTGQEVKVSTKIKGTKFWKKNAGDIIAGAVYFVVDWGDGTWSYNGPGLQNETTKSTVNHYHTYKKAGTYFIRAAAFNMQTDEMVGWSEGKPLVVAGQDVAYEGVINNVKPISSATYDGAHGAEKITDGDSDSYFKSNVAEDAYEEQYVGYLFDDNYTLDTVEVQIPQDAEIFPSNIAIEYTSDYGRSWQSLPKYYYLYDHAQGTFNPLMRFPNPKGATLVLGLDGIVANGLRFTSKLTSVNFSDMAKEKYLAVSEMRVYGNKRTLFYTSLGNTFDADINNMWTIFGSAKTEPNLTGDPLSSATNQSPFRTGHTLIGSTEWLEWNGLKFNWTDYDDARETAYSYLKNTRTGADGWSEGNVSGEAAQYTDGYVWATANGQYHLDMGAHYTYNSIFILAARNYLMQGNNLGEMNGDEITNFMDMKNGVGQTMRARLDKAMGYMLHVLDGKTGVLVIKDPRNKGLAGAGASVASNYWDAMTAFGYISSYENIFYYASLLAYADILEYCGEDATYYRQLAALTKQRFNETFWDRTKKRYITSINVDGERLDFGVTYVNFMAVALGLANDVQTQAIYSWLDGERIIESDTSKGEDIYGTFKYAARGNTVDVSKITDANGQWYWWYNAETMSPAQGSGAYGNQMQNGGTIFYTSYYDLMGRYTMDKENAFRRFSTIVDEFHKDSLRRNTRTYYGEYVEGVVGEFPESGLVPYIFVNSLVGLKATTKGLQISAALPAEMDYAGVSTYRYGNRTYSIRVDKTVTQPKVEKYDDGSFYVIVPAEETWYITLDNRLVKAEA